MDDPQHATLQEEPISGLMPSVGQSQRPFSTTSPPTSRIRLKINPMPSEDLTPEPEGEDEVRRNQNTSIMTERAQISEASAADAEQLDPEYASEAEDDEDDDDGDGDDEEYGSHYGTKMVATKARRQMEKKGKRFNRRR